jgi:hypothetical protein
MPEKPASPPRMSYVLVTDGFETIRSVVDRLREQTVRGQLELVLVAPSEEAVATGGGEFEGFGSVRVVPVDAPLALGDARAAGVRAASAPVVFIGETHSFPHDRLAEALLEAHDGSWAVVVPGFGNVNPDDVLSWAGFLSDYGAWVAELPAGEMDYAPIYNASYRRSVLLELGDALGSALSQGDEMLIALREGEHRIYFEPAARIDHLNLSRPTAYVRERYGSGVLIAGERARRWPWRRRLLYLAGAPLLPAVYLSRVVSGVRTVRRSTRLPLGTSAAVLLGCVAKAAGEMTGYALGPRPAAEPRMAEYELHKAAYVSTGAR